MTLSQRGAHKTASSDVSGLPPHKAAPSPWSITGILRRLGLPLFLAHATVLLSAVLLCVAGLTAAEPIVFYPAYAPSPADNPLKGRKPFHFANVDQEQDRVGWLTLGKIVVP